MNRIFRHLLLFAMMLSLSGCGVMNFFIRVGVKPSEIKYALTQDSWRIALYHYPARGLIKHKTPVVLCHGMALNHYFWNLDQDVNFSGYLASKGFDVWTVDLRGNGRSKRVNRFGDFKSADVQEGKERVKSSSFWTVDDYAKYDIPAILDFVTQETGRDQVTWIGHSMGGMVMYVFLETSEDVSKVKNFVALGSPVVLPHPANDLLKEMEELQKSIDGLIDVGLKGLRTTALLTPLTSELNPLDTLYFNRKNVDWDNVQRMYAHSLENIPRGVSRQMRELIETGEFKSYDKSFNYAKNLDRIKVPALLLAGKGDALGSEYAVLTAYNGISSEDKTYRLFGTENRYGVNYGHCDLVFGETAPKEVYPFIEKWLVSHD